MIISKIRKLLGIESDDERLQRLIKVNESISDLSKSIDEVAEEFTVKNENFKQLLHSSTINDEIKKSVKVRYDNFLEHQKEDLQNLVRERNSLREQHKELIKDEKLFKAISDLSFYDGIKKKFKEGEVSLSTFDLLITAKQGKVKYADNIVLNEKGQLLILQRARVEDDKNGGKWCLPGGHVDAGEEFEEAAIRELKEESGIYVDEVEEIGVYEDDKAEIHYFKSSVTEVEAITLLQNGETESSKWIDLKDIDQYSMPFNMAENIKALICEKDTPVTLPEKQSILGEIGDTAIEKIKQILSRKVETIEKAINTGSISKELGEELIEKARAGIYSNTPENRKLGRVGQKYGSKKEEVAEDKDSNDKNLSKEDWEKLPGYGDIRYYKGKIYVKTRSLIYKVRDYFNHYENFLKHDQQKLFYRATNNKEEASIKGLRSTNHLTGDKEVGVSVYYTDVYKQKSSGAQEYGGKKYIGLVSGKLVGFGSDGEPLLNEIKWELEPTTNLPKKYSREFVEKKRELTAEETPWNKLSFSPFDNDVVIIDDESEIEKAYLNGTISQEIFEKARSGKYADTPENKRLKRVGQSYGSKKDEETKEEKEGKKEPETDKKQGEEKPYLQEHIERLKKDGFNQVKTDEKGNVFLYNKEKNEKFPVTKGDYKKYKDKIDEILNKKESSIEEHARAASETALQNAAKGGDEEHRKAAKAELDRREKEEAPKDTNKEEGKETSPIDELNEKIEGELNNQDNPLNEINEKIEKEVNAKEEKAPKDHVTYKTPIGQKITRSDGKKFEKVAHTGDISKDWKEIKEETKKEEPKKEEKKEGKTKSYQTFTGNVQETVDFYKKDVEKTGEEMLKLVSGKSTTISDSAINTLSILGAVTTPLDMINLFRDKEFQKNILGDLTEATFQEKEEGKSKVDVSDFSKQDKESPYMSADITTPETKGHVSIKEMGDKTATIADIQIGYEGKEGRGKGYGTDAYIEIGKKLAEKGVTLESTNWEKHGTAISPQALKVWEKLEKQGYAKKIGEKVGKVLNRESGEEESKKVPLYSFVSKGNDIEKSEQEDIFEKSTHKYIRKEPSGNGGWNYIYKESNETLSKLEKNIEKVSKKISKLGVEHLYCFDEEGNKIFQVTSSSANKVIIPNEFENKLTNSHLIHNHPKGNCFSLNDIHVCLFNKTKTTRVAVSDSKFGEGVYFFENNSSEKIDLNEHLKEINSELDKWYDSKETNSELKNETIWIDVFKELEIYKKNSKNISIYFKGIDGNKIQL